MELIILQEDWRCVEMECGVEYVIIMDIGVLTIPESSVNNWDTPTKVWIVLTIYTKRGSCYEFSLTP